MPSVSFILTSTFVVVFLEFACFSLAHWFFGHQYYKIPIVMPIVRKKKEIPKEID